MTLLKEIVYYFNVFRKYLGNRLYIVFIFSALAVATEAFGIALLLPLLELLDAGGSDGDPNRITRMLQQLLDTIGIGDSVVGVLLFITFVFFLKAAILFAAGAYNALLSANLLREMKESLFKLYSNMSYEHYASKNTGHFINIISNQVYRLLSAFMTFKGFLTNVIVTLIYTIFAFLISWHFALMAVTAGIAIFFLFSRLNKYMKDLSRLTSQENTTLHVLLVQTLQGFLYIASTAQFDRLGKRVMESVYKLTSYYRTQSIAGSFTSAIREPVSVIMILIIVIIQLVVIEARIAPILVSLLLIHRIMGHVFSIQGSWQSIMGLVGSIEMVEKEFEEVGSRQEPDGSEAIPSLSREIVFENATFIYQGREQPALNQVSFRINAHDTVALFGPSGAGKSTLINMISLLLVPQNGRICIDGIPHDHISKNSWRSRIGYVTQDSVMFDDTLGNNIALWTGDYRKDADLAGRIESAAERANAMEFIRDLPDGLDTLIGERGIKLSGGQKQRICIARELFKEPALLILDEATSALDSESESAIHDSIQQLKGKITIVMIAHRISTIRNADKILLLQDGRLVAEGSYNELLNHPEFLKVAEGQLS